MNMRRGTCMLDEHKHKTRQLLTKVSIEKKFEISKAVARNIKEKNPLIWASWDTAMILKLRENS